MSTLDWNQIGTIIGSSAIISGVVSAVVNYIITMRQLKKERKVTMLRDKLNLYSLIIYHLENILHWYIHPPSMEGKFNLSKGINEIVEEYIQIVDSEIKNKFYLLNYDAASKWMDFKRQTSQFDTKMHSKIKNNLFSLRNILAKEYNDIISPQYKSIVGISVEPIPYNNLQKEK